MRLPQQDGQAVRAAPRGVEAVGDAVQIVERGPQRAAGRFVERLEAQLRVIGEARARQRRGARGGDEARRPGGGGERVDEARLIVGGEAMEVVEQPQAGDGGEAARDVGGALLVAGELFDDVARELAAHVVEERRQRRVRDALAHDGARPARGERVRERRFADAGHADDDCRRHLRGHLRQPRQLRRAPDEKREARRTFRLCLHPRLLQPRSCDHLSPQRLSRRMPMTEVRAARYFCRRRNFRSAND